MYLLFQKRQALENNNQLEPRVSNRKIHLIAMKKVEIFQEIKVHEGIKIRNIGTSGRPFSVCVAVVVL